ncbi:MAG TPA: adenylyl-sulfate kinase [Allosphingosinicella sp.]|nr:adenylyl-sulfate kinase [Allosphingosinicella sp.]
MADLLRFLTCGSVDDGKSTLIGRMLHDCGAVAKDRLEGLTDFSLLADGLEAEREQGITIDVAYLYFATEHRRFILADCPGHEQYTRNMATGASNAELALVLVDATKSVLAQTRRHAMIARLLGIEDFVFAVNKMDLAGFDEARFKAVRDDVDRLAGALDLDAFQVIPVSAIDGDNVTGLSPRTPWYDGPALLPWLEEVRPFSTGALDAFRMPVQQVIREADTRFYAGMVASGAVKPGDKVTIAPAGTPAEVARIVTMDGDLAEAEAGQPIALAFAAEVDCSRGDLIAAADPAPHVADAFEADLIWMAEEPLLPGRQYLLKLGTRTVPATVQEPKYKLGIDTMEQLAARTLALNEIGAAVIHTAQPIAFEPYAASRALGGFILIDRLTSATVAAGLIRFALRRSENVHAQVLDVTPERRAALKDQKPKLLWFTGLSGAGKSTIANLVEARLHARGRHTFLLDGDNVRLGLNKDLGFTAADRVENIRRAGEAAKLMMDAGLIVLTAFISPFRAERALVREMVGDADFVEIFVDTPLAEAERRDTKGLYRKARAGQLANFTGVDSPYETPEQPDIRIDTMTMDAEAAAELIVRRLESE